MKSKQAMSSLDVHACIGELEDILISGTIKNIYQVSEKIYLFKIRTFQGSQDLLVEPGVRIHLTNYKRKAPERPSNKLLALRKHIKNTRITGINQYNTDRIVVINLTGKTDYEIVIEIFGKGNIVVLDSSRKVIYALWYRKMRDRDLLPGKQFAFPPSFRGKFLLDITKEDLVKFQTEVDKNSGLGKALALQFGGGGELVNEIVARKEINSSIKVSNISESLLNNLSESIYSLKEDFKSLNPIIVEDNNNTPQSVHPIPFHSVTGNLKQFKTFNKALDEFFTPKESLSHEIITTEDSKMKKLKKTLEKQESHLVQLKEEVIKYRNKGEAIHLVAHHIEELQKTIVNARRDGTTWEEIRGKIELGKKKGIDSAHLFNEIDTTKGKISILIQGTPVLVDLKESPYQIGERYYLLAKKAERKVPAAKVAISDIKSQLESVKEKKSELVEEDSIKLLKRTRRWYEKYHWTRTINGFLVIAGRDARTNEELVRNRLSNQDLFFHAEIQGAPHTILLINSSDKELQEEDLQNATIIAGAYSRAWKRGIGAIDVYHVPGTQVSFSAPSGEYVPKGGAIVRGKRTMHSNVLLSLCIGVSFSENWAQIIAGQVDAIQPITKYHLTLVPGDNSKSKIAKFIRDFFSKSANEMEKRFVRALDLNEIISFIPGDSRILEE